MGKKTKEDHRNENVTKAAMKAKVLESAQAQEHKRQGNQDALQEVEDEDRIEYSAEEERVLTFQHQRRTIYTGKYNFYKDKNIDKMISLYDNQLYLDILEPFLGMRLETAARNAVSGARATVDIPLVKYHTFLFEHGDKLKLLHHIPDYMAEDLRIIRFLKSTPPYAREIYPSYFIPQEFLDISTRALQYNERMLAEAELGVAKPTYEKTVNPYIIAAQSTFLRDHRSSACGFLLTVVQDFGSRPLPYIDFYLFMEDLLLLNLLE